MVEPGENSFEALKADDLNSLNYRLHEQERINNFLREEVVELRSEIKELHNSRFFKIINYLNKLIVFRVVRKVLRVLNAGILNISRNKKFTPEQLKLSVDIIIPVYNKYDLLSNLLASMRIHNCANLKKIIIVDDSGNKASKQKIESILDILNIDKSLFLIQTNEMNLGFGKSVNSVWQFTNSDLVILINTDVELPEYWLERMVLPFKDEEVALATPLATNSGANLTIDLHNKLNWRDFDTRLAKLKANYPPACTAIGYCLAIRRSAIQKNTLFNPEYVNGYGEDSDLHFELLAFGHKSVVIDNLLVWHQSSASYSTRIDLAEFKNSNVKKFHEKWGSRYQRDLALWNNANPLKKIDKLSLSLSKRKSVDFLFIQLSNKAEIGGIAQFQTIFKELVLRHEDVGIVYINHDPTGNQDSSELVFNKAELNELDVKKVIFSGLESFNFLKNYSNLFKSKKINFFQGPDYLFPGNESLIEDFKESLHKVDFVVCQSDYLRRLANFFGSKRAETITLGPKKSIFYDLGINKEKVLLIPTRKDSDKGFRFLQPILPALKSAGWQTVGYGDLTDPLLANIFSKHLGRISTEEVASQLQVAAGLIDLSIYEGLGLSALEAGLCGTQPIVSRKGGINSLNGFADELLLIDDPLDLTEIYSKINSLEMKAIEKNRSNLSQKASQYSWEASIDKLIDEIIKC